jgi:hypothetical protein
LHYEGKSKTLAELDDALGKGILKQYKGKSKTLDKLNDTLDQEL